MVAYQSTGAITVQEHVTKEIPIIFFCFFELFRPLPKPFFATWCVRGAPFFFTFPKRYGASGGTAA